MQINPGFFGFFWDFSFMGADADGNQILGVYMRTQTHTDTDRQTDRERERQTDRQTDR